MPEAYLSREDGRGNGPIVGKLRVHDRPQDAMALQAQVAWLSVCLAVAEECAELQLQIHLRRLAAGRLPLDGRAAHATDTLHTDSLLASKERATWVILDCA